MIIDVEGVEEPIIRSLVDSMWRPLAIIAELADRHESFGAFPEIQESHARTRQMILDVGYREEFSDEINTIFARNV